MYIVFYFQFCICCVLRYVFQLYSSKGHILKGGWNMSGANDWMNENYRKMSRVQWMSDRALHSPSPHKVLMSTVVLLIKLMRVLHQFVKHTDVITLLTLPFYQTMDALIRWSSDICRLISSLKRPIRWYKTCKSSRTISAEVGKLRSLALHIPLSVCECVFEIYIYIYRQREIERETSWVTPRTN